MSLNNKLLQKLTSAFGVMGDEEEVMGVVKSELDSMGVKHEETKYGDVLCGKLDQPALLLAAHCDEVGFMVRSVNEDGTLGVINLGWVKPHMLNETSVVIKTVSGEKVMAQGFATVPMLDSDVPTFADVILDVGADSAEEIEKMGVRVGDIGTFQKEFRMTDNAVFASALDNRLGVYQLLEYIRANPSVLDKAAVAFHTHEEANFEGLRGVVDRVQPTYTVILDVFPVHQELSRTDTPYGLGQGPSVLYQAGRYVMHYPMRKRFEALDQSLFKKVVIDTGPIEMEPLGVQKMGQTMATALYTPVRGYHAGVYTARVADIERMKPLLDAAIPAMTE
ncbi:MAG: hypothetical protein ABIG66_02175 [Candidatus Kerfeldbacteria bacterium]